MKRSYSQFLEGSAGPDPTSDVSKKFVMDVRDRLGAGTEKLREYHKVWADFQNERISMEDCITRVKEKLQGHPDLMQRFLALFTVIDSNEDPPQGQNPTG